MGLENDKESLVKNHRGVQGCIVTAYCDCH